MAKNRYAHAEREARKNGWTVVSRADADVESAWGDIEGLFGR